MEIYRYYPGNNPIIVSIPHAGTYIPEDILKRFTPSAKHLPDTDWHLDQLYAFVRELGAHLLMATHSRYVIDLNRPPDNQSLYPGKFTTGLCPLTLFDGTPIYQQDREPENQEVADRIQLYWRPYHSKLKSIIEDLKQYKRKIIFDAHSICSQVPTLFEGILPNLNFGTANGVSADEELINKMVSNCKENGYSVVSNARFKGGYITRYYGDPKQGRHAIQLEMSQLNYMQETYPYTYEINKANRLQKTLRGLFFIMMKWTDSENEH